MDCNQAKDYLVDSVIGSELAGEVASHLASCPSCRREREELALAWASLDRLKAVRFPRSVTRETVKRVAKEEKLAGRSFRRPVFASPAALWRSGWVALAAAAAAAAIVYYAVSPKEDGLADRTASVFRADSSPLPDPAATLDSFLDRAEEILAAADRGEYRRWGDVFREVFRSDLEGQGRYLLDSLAPDSPARPAVQSANDAIWALLRAGRGREGEAFAPPPGADLPEALQAIRALRESKGKK